MADDNRAKLKRGAIKLPPVDSAMNKTMPKARGGGKGSKDDADFTALDATKPKDQNEDEKILDRARRRMDNAITAESDNRKEAVQDRKALSGDQWDAAIMASRQQDQRPCLTINKLKTFWHQIVNDQRQNRPAIHFSPVGDVGDPETAKMFSGLFRFVERESAADIAYDTAFGDAADSGFGYFRMMTEYEKPNSFNQVLTIRRIRNPFTVYLDCQRQEPDGSDSKWGFISEQIPRGEFTDRWPWADPCNWDKAGIGETLKNWITQNDVRVAEYFEVHYEKKRLIELDNGWVGKDEDLSDEVRAQIESGALTVENERDAEFPEVRWYRITGKQILERNIWVGQWIPIFPVIGDEIDIEGKVKLAGIVRDARSPQDQYNYVATAMTEVTCLIPKAPYIGAEGQFEGHEEKWLQANTKSFPYLEYSPKDLEGNPQPPPQRQQPPGVPQGLQQLLQNAAQDMMAVTGIRFDSTVAERLSDESGIAINALQQRGDLTNFHYIDNLARTMRHLGRCFIDAVPKVYDNRRVLTILREDGTTEQRVKLDPNGKPGESIKDSNGKTLPIFNPTAGEYGVTVTIGPSFATKRNEASQRMIEFAKVFPQFAEAFSDLIAKNQDWPGGEELTLRLSKLVAQKYPGVLSPDMKDVPPQVQAMIASMDQQLKQLTQQYQMALKELGDKQADRALAADKISKDFEARLLKIVADIETKTAATTEKAVGTFITHLRAVADQGLNVAELAHKVSTTPAPEAANSGAAP